MTYSSLQVFSAIESVVAAKPSVHLSEVSKVIKVERHSIERSVREATGLSFRKYRQRKILVRAVNLLHTDNPIMDQKTIAFDLGYRSTGSLGRAIKRMTGMTPSQIRREQANGSCLVV